MLWLLETWIINFEKRLKYNGIYSGSMFSSIAWWYFLCGIQSSRSVFPQTQPWTTQENFPWFILDNEHVDQLNRLTQCGFVYLNIYSLFLFSKIFVMEYKRFNFSNLIILGVKQGLVKGAKLSSNPYFFGWLEKWVGWL